MLFYSKNPLFACIDFIILFRSFLRNPYQELGNTRFFSLDLGDVYGETPLVLLKRISQQFGLTSDDIFYDLGSGLGRVAFWVSHFVKCRKVVGIERIPSFVSFSSGLQKKFLSSRLSFIEGDFANCSIVEATFIYFYGTSYSSEILRVIATRLQILKKGTIVVTVSFPITDFVDQGFICTEMVFGRFPWGRTILFKNVKCNEPQLKLLV